MENKSVILPKWLDDLIFGILSAKYSKKNKDLVVLEWEKNEVLCYLGTYFPRSFAESYHIFSNYFFKYKCQYQDKTSISLFFPNIPLRRVQFCCRRTHNIVYF